MKVYNKHHGDAPKGAVYIGRGSPYGNPYVISKTMPRNEAIRLYEQNILPNLDIEPLRGKDLVCFCKPCNCHGDSIIAKLENTPIEFDWKA